MTLAATGTGTEKEREEVGRSRRGREGRGREEEGREGREGREEGTTNVGNQTVLIT